MRTVGADLPNCGHAIRLKIIMQRGDEVLTKLVARSFRAPVRVARLARLE